jgi:mono/diheme cytochrome c family protein
MKMFGGVMLPFVLMNSLVLAQMQLSPIDKGERLYQRNCLRCHGPALDGKGPDAVTLRVPPTNFHTYLSRLKDNGELEKTIKEGKKFLGMHNWEDTLSDEQVRDLIAYIRSAAPPVKANPRSSQRVDGLPGVSPIRLELYDELGIDGG